jgi:hypothetical protein
MGAQQLHKTLGLLWLNVTFQQKISLPGQIVSTDGMKMQSVIGLRMKMPQVTKNSCKF